MPSPSSSATRRSSGRTTVLPPTNTDHRAVAIRRATVPPTVSAASGASGCSQSEADLIAVEEVTKLGAGGIPALPDHDRPRRRRLRGEPLQPPCPGHPVARERADRLGDDRIHRRDRVVLGRLDPQHARLDGGAETNREDGSEHDRNLAEHVARQPLPDDPHRPVDRLHRFDPAFEHGEQRAILALVRRVLARHQAHVRRRARQTLRARGAEHRKYLDPSDLLRRHHGKQPRPHMAESVRAGRCCGRLRPVDTSATH